MKILATAVLAFALSGGYTTAVLAAPDNQRACKQGKAEYEKEGMTEEQCLCMLGEADKHMPPKMKDAFVESLLANDKNPLQRFMQLGVSMEELMKVMDAYGNGVEKTCGL